MLDEHYQTILLVFQKISASSLQLLQSSKLFFPLVFSVVVITDSSTFNRRLYDRMMHCSTLEPDRLVLEVAGHGFHLLR